MITASVYDSKYKGGDDKERDTRFNQNFVLNILSGKEWQLNNNNTFSINGKLTIIGGKRQSPVNNEKSNRYKYVFESARCLVRRYNFPFAQNIASQSKLLGFAGNSVCSG